MKAAVTLLSLAVAGAAAVGSSSTSTWSGWGGNYLNNHWAADNHDLNSTTVSSLSLHCKIPDSVGQSAPPAIRGEVAYYPTYNGSFVALNYSSCEVLWRINVTQVLVNFRAISALQLLVNTPISRTSPQIDTANNVIYFGTQIHALLVAADLTSGTVLGVTQTNPHELATITTSPTFYDGLVIVGVSSGEEDAAFFSNGTYQCCSFIGNAAAFRFKRTGRSTGRFTTIWNVTTIPTNLPPANGTSQWSGAAIWGSQPSIDVRRRQVFFATGNMYSVPDAYAHCVDDPDVHCFPSYIWQESVLAFDLYTGHANWVRRLDSLDAWTLVCGGGGLPRNTTLCPQNPGTDADFGMAPTFIPGGSGSRTPQGRDLLAVGQKSGVLYGLAADSGDVLWSTLTSPGSELAGLSWGVAADDRRVYYTGINDGQKTWVLQPQNTTAVNNSIFGAADLRDGSLLWQIPDTGEVLWSYELVGGFQGGVAVQGKYVFLGTGYKGGTGGAFWVFKAS
ncbi:uncharacterized protein THITE_122540 [Thermothielavioides terrestris NRRL 8126]|uniref:Quino protein alcohol dehydrogenase-like protein n=1 Tax=Thermothielavioides terrestris (strain ATCC 38088 / NRRL 8126) TaxID=578455 RepID=G2RD34_THETT|nr:uncharacterized protein THITE_122540 [Thermothielavioides terrestris NRRL 8126]AEO70727.1 hypothetical protein THITE_122540 [Thermothielavioides terrestris NRRL 8126]